MCYPSFCPAIKLIRLPPSSFSPPVAGSPVSGSTSTDMLPPLAARTNPGFSAFNTAKFLSASQFQILSAAKTRFISSSVRWLVSGYRAQTTRMERALTPPKM